MNIKNTNKTKDERLTKKKERLRFLLSLVSYN